MRQNHLTLLTESGEQVAAFGWMPGSNAVLIAEGPGVTTQLRVFDLNGRSLGVVDPTPSFAVGGDDGVAVAPDGRSAILTASSRPALSSRAVHELIEVDLATGSSRVLTDPSKVDATAPAFVDAARLVFADSTAGRTAVAALDVTSGAVSTLGAGRPVGLGGNGGYVAVQSGRDLLAVALTGGRPARRLARVPAGSDVVAVDPVGVRAVIRDVLVAGADAPPVARLRSVRLKG